MPLQIRAPFGAHGADPFDDPVPSGPAEIVVDVEAGVDVIVGRVKGPVSMVCGGWKSPVPGAVVTERGGWVLPVPLGKA